MKKLAAVVMALALLACGLSAFAGAEPAPGDAMEPEELLCGEWVDVENRGAEMVITKNAALGWDVEIVIPATHGAYVFQATIINNGERHGFTYDKGKYWEVPVTDSDEGAGLGEAKVAGATGIFSFSGDDQNLYLSWVDDATPDQEILFRPAHASMAAAPGDFVGEWNDERVCAVIEERAGEYEVTISGSNGASESTAWFYTCAYDEATNSLVSNGEVAIKVNTHFDEAGEPTEEVVYRNGEAVFTLDDAGMLIWDDKLENAGEGRTFERAAGTAPIDPGVFQK